MLPATAMRGREPTITEFLTDGALAALCDHLSQIAGAEVTLHDVQGRRISPAEGTPPWRIGEVDHSAREVVEAFEHYRPVLPEREVAAAPLVIAPLTALGRVIGCIAVRPDKTRKGTSLTRLRAIVRQLASTVSELCDQDMRYRERNAELNVLFRLSSLLVEARDVEAILNVALRSAADLLEADAGSVHLLDETEENLRLRARVGLSPGFVERIDAYPLLRSADRHQLHARAHTLAELNELQRQELLAEISGEGFAEVIACGLIFKGRPIGVLRLYQRSPAHLDTADRSLLQTIVEQAAAAAASARLMENERKHREVQRQLALGADVQQRMLPGSVPIVPGLDLAARYMSCFELGGDFYDFIDLSGNLGVLIGDVSGKGVAAALLMASLRAIFSVLAKDVYHLDQLMARVNETMARDTLPNEFATVFYGVIDPKPRADGGRRFTYCNAGHDPPMLFRPSRDATAGAPPQLIELTTGGMIIGIDPLQKYERGIIDLHPGDTLVLYTDGIIDAMNFQDKKFGRARLREALLSHLASHPEAAARSVTDHVTWEVRRFIGLRDETDDSTLVAIRIKK